MTREEIEQLYVEEPNCFETGREEQWYKVGLKEGLAAADSHPQWIPVEERLPDEGQEVFAWNGTFKESYKCIYHDGLFEDYLGELGKGAVSHWMPIVPPRKEE